MSFILNNFVEMNRSQTDSILKTFEKVLLIIFLKITIVTRKKYSKEMQNFKKSCKMENSEVVYILKLYSELNLTRRK